MISSFVSFCHKLLNLRDVSEVSIVEQRMRMSIFQISITLLFGHLQIITIFRVFLSKHNSCLIPG